MLEDTVNDEPEASRLTLQVWRQFSGVKKKLWLLSTNIYIKYVSRNNPSVHIVAWMFEEHYFILLTVKQRRCDWRNVSPALIVPISDGITLPEHSGHSF